MKTTAEKRRFALPIGIAVAAHAFLLLGFSHPKTVITTGAKAPPPRTEPPIIVELEPPEPPEVAPADAPHPKPSLPALPDVVVDTSTRPLFRMDPKFVDTSHEGPATNIIPVHWTTGGPRRNGPGGIISVGMLDQVPRAIVRVPPAYPAQLRALGVSGEVFVEFVVDEAGRVGDVRVIRSSHSEFEAVALKALVKWRFEPGRLHGHPVRFRMAMPLNFTIGE
ncbi:MAG TPA: TonB family protein [Opitutaceae bacterium]|nr:TonB family protein [Opitutaceae bacterium]